MNKHSRLKIEETYLEEAHVHRSIDGTVDSVTVHFIEGIRVSLPCERPSVKVFDAQHPDTHRGKILQGALSGTTSDAEEKTLPAFRKFAGRDTSFPYL